MTNTKHQSAKVVDANLAAVLRCGRGAVVAVSGILLLAASLVSAQKLVDISSCVSIVKDTERFACYENLAHQSGALPPAQSAQQAPSAPATTAATPAPTPPTNSAVHAATSQGSAAPATSTDSSRIAAFGAAIGKALLQTDTDGQEMLLDTVTAAKYYKPDIWQVTLSSGQIWRQMNARDFSLRVGDKVQIFPSGWGKSYRLTVEGRSGFIQVERLDNKVHK
jgi:hypothetical protein